MNISLNQPSYNLDYFIKALYELFDNLKDSKDDIKKNISACSQIRAKRRSFQKDMRKFIKNFHDVPEKKQVDVELYFFNAIKDLEVAIPLMKKRAKEEVNICFALFLIRELDKLLKIFKSSQKKMSDKIYPDHSKEILSNPGLYKELVDAWGELSEDEY